MNIENNISLIKQNQTPSIWNATEGHGLRVGHSGSSYFSSFLPQGICTGH